MKQVITFIIVLFSMAALPSQAQKSENDGTLKFDQQVIEAGTMTEDDAPRTYTFIGRNVSGSVQEITRIQTTCGCTKSSIDKLKLQPGDSCKIELVFTPNGYPGTIDTRAFVYLKGQSGKPSSTSSKQSPSTELMAAKIGLHGMVLPSADVWYRFRYQMGDLRLKQNKVAFKEV